MTARGGWTSAPRCTRTTASSSTTSRAASSRSRPTVCSGSPRARCCHSRRPTSAPRRIRDLGRAILVAVRSGRARLQHPVAQPHRLSDLSGARGGSGSPCAPVESRWCCAPGSTGSARAAAGCACSPGSQAPNATVSGGLSSRCTRRASTTPGSLVRALPLVALATERT